jgi:hypothetical protein
VSRCNAIKPNGERCQRSADGQHGLCWAHDPTNATERRRTASRGGRDRASKEVRAVRELMDRLTEQVRHEGLEPAILYAVVAAQNTKLRAVEVERKLVEQAEVLERIRTLEAQERQQRGGYGTWGR